MNAVWNTLVDGIQGNFVKPIDVAGCVAQQYDMGRPVGTFTVDVQDAEAAETVADKPAKVAKVAKERKGTKADTVRGMIAAAKAEGRATDAVIAEVVTVLGMARALASAYVKNNWNKA